MLINFIIFFIGCFALSFVVSIALMCFYLIVGQPYHGDLFYTCHKYGQKKYSISAEIDEYFEHLFSVCFLQVLSIGFLAFCFPKLDLPLKIVLSIIAIYPFVYYIKMYRNRDKTKKNKLKEEIFNKESGLLGKNNLKKFLHIVFYVFLYVASGYLLFALVKSNMYDKFLELPLYIHIVVLVLLMTFVIYDVYNVGVTTINEILPLFFLLGNINKYDILPHHIIFAIIVAICYIPAIYIAIDECECGIERNKLFGCGNK